MKEELWGNHIFQETVIKKQMKFLQVGKKAVPWAIFVGQCGGNGKQAIDALSRKDAVEIHNPGYPEEGPPTLFKFVEISG